MTNDKIQDRLREWDAQDEPSGANRLMCEAADHIEALEAELHETQMALGREATQRDELAAALRGCLDNMKAAHARFNTDCCMCGSDISGQAHCDNHMTTDSGEYYAHQAIKAGEEALAKLEKDND